MSEIINCDPNRGFVAFPVDLFDLDLSPGAFRTLAELCRMANTQGQCWPSLAQLGRKLGRSRASVSGYITELRSAGVLATQEQKMANGYNYRLRYTVTFWKKWRSGLGRRQEARPVVQAKTSPVQSLERSVRPSERPLRTKNHIHKNNCRVGFENNMLGKWKTAVGKAPYPAFDTWPSEDMISVAEAARLAPTTQPPISADIKGRIDAFLAKRDIAPSDPDLAMGLLPLVPSISVLEAMITALDALWQSHWRNPPTVFQLRKILADLPKVQDPASQAKLLKSYLRRWKLYQQSLPSGPIGSNVGAMQYPRI